MNAPATRGYPSIGKFVGAAAAVVAALAAWRAYDQRALPASIDAVLPLGAKQVAIVRRDQRGWESGRDYNDSYLDVIDADKGRLWHRTIPHASIDTMLSPFLHNVVLVGDAMILRGRARVGTHDQIRLLAYNSSNGQPLWNAAPFPATNGFEPNFHASLLVADTPNADTVLVFADEIDAKTPFGKVVRIVALDTKTGAERWRAQENDSLTSAFRLRGGSLVVTTMSKLRVIDLATGKDRASFSHQDKACIDATDAWFVDAGGFEELHFDDLKLRPHATPSIEGFGLLGTCGRRNGKVWFLASDQSRYDSGPKQRWLVSVDPATDAAATLASLGTFEMVPGMNDENVATDLVPFSGDLDRFVPLIVSGDTALTATGATRTLGASLLMLDLDQGQGQGQGGVAWRSAIREDISQDMDALWRAGNVDLYAKNRPPPGSLAAFDRGTGQMTGSLGRPQRGAWSAAFGEIWIDDEWNVAAYDAKTMTKSWSTGNVQTSDVTAAMKSLLAP